MRWRTRFTRAALVAAPLLLIGVVWEMLVRLQPAWVFFFGAPSRIVYYTGSGMADGWLMSDIVTTGGEALAGLAIGTLTGTALGVALWLSPVVHRIVRPYVIALGAAPVFAFAPAIIVWFGTGFVSKMMVAAFSTVFVALSQAFSGASEVEQRFTVLMKSFGATRMQVFRKAIAPGAITWAVAGLRLNVGLALLGAFLGEFISSERGLGHRIVVSSGLFDMSMVMCAVLMFVLLGLLLNLAVSFIEARVRRVLVEWL